MRVSVFNDDIKQKLLTSNDIYLEGYLRGFDKALDDMFLDNIIENPEILYESILDDYRKMKICIFKNNQAFNSKIIINDLIRKYKNKVN